MTKGTIKYLICTLFVGQILTEQNLQLVSDANNRFTVDFYKTLAKKDGNVICSPLSAHAVLSMAYQGARRSTKTAFENTLYLSDKPQVADSYSGLIKHLNNEVQDVDIVMANKLFLQKNLVPKEDFNRTLSEKYESGLQFVDFRQPAEAASAIDDFVTSKTENKIKDLFTEEDFQVPTSLVLVNTLYFKGQWRLPFSERLTQLAPFYTDSDKTVDVEMMYVHNGFRNSFNDVLNATVLQMQFTNKDLSMLAILPKEKDGIKDVESKLTYEVLREAVDSLGHSIISLNFPKFTITQAINMHHPLKELGLGILFDRDNCDLSDMIENVPLYISKAVQKVYIGVDEKGCEAAAASGLRASPRSLGFNLKFDHPFIFAIIERYQGGFNVLFIGRITDPTVTNVE